MALLNDSLKSGYDSWWIPVKDEQVRFFVLGGSHVTLIVVLN